MKYLVLCLFLMSCVTTSIQKLNPATYYKNDICFEYKTGKKIPVSGSNDDLFSGQTVDEVVKFCKPRVLPYKDSYALKVIGYDNLNFFTIMSCHEEQTSENPDRGIFKKNGVVNIVYKPTLDRDLKCPVYVSAYSKREKHAFGMLIFEHPYFKLKSTVKCNGDIDTFNGISVCESRADLVQNITFDEEVEKVKPVSGAAERTLPCPELESKDSKSFTFNIPPRECIYQFIGKKSGLLHRFYTIGYEDIIVRGD